MVAARTPRVLVVVLEYCHFAAAHCSRRQYCYYSMPVITFAVLARCVSLTHHHTHGMTRSARLDHTRRHSCYCLKNTTRRFCLLLKYSAFDKHCFKIPKTGYAPSIWSFWGAVLIWGVEFSGGASKNIKITGKK